MRKILFAILLYSTLSHCQCDDYNKLKIGGTYLSRTNNYIPFEIKHKDSIYRKDIFYPFDLRYIEKYSDQILSKAKTYIINRAGQNFYNNIQLESIEVNYPETVKVEYENLELYKLENYDVKYYTLYTYTKDEYKYAFGLFFDKKGNLISENVFPEISKNPNFENYKNPCEALSIVKNNKRFRNEQVDFIELVYLDEINSFCWLVKEKKIPKKLGINKYKIDSFFVNANTNKLVKIDVDEVTSIACGI